MLSELHLYVYQLQDKLFFVIDFPLKLQIPSCCSKKTAYLKRIQSVGFSPSSTTCKFLHLIALCGFCMLLHF